MPSERLFTERLGISRITVRKALACLEQDGIIGRSRGYGTLSNRSGPSRSCSIHWRTSGFSREVIQQGRRPDTQWISRERMPAGAELAEKLQLAAGTPIYQLKRIHLIDRRPMSVAVSYVVVTAIANVDEIGISLYDYFRRNKVEMGSLRSQVSAAMADDDIRQALRLSEPMPLLIVRQTLFDHHKSRSNTAKASAAATCTSLPAKADPLRHAVAYASPCRRRRKRANA